MGSLGSLRNLTAITPVEISGPTGFITEVALADGAATKRSGFHPMAAVFLSAWAEKRGTANSISVSAPALLRLTICESMVGSVTS